MKATTEPSPEPFRLVRANNPGPLTLAGTNTYLFGSTVIDPGPDDEGHLAEILRKVSPERILLTHAHPDHAAGAARLGKTSGAPILGHENGLRDGQKVSGLVAVHTPGHAPDHLCFYHEESRTLLSGDLIAGQGSIMVAPPGGDLAAYVASLRKVRALEPSRLLPGHGPPVPDARAKIDEYLAHREERERKVVEALESGAKTLDEVVESAYADTPPEMLPYARLSAQAHLLKLGRDPA